MTRRTFWIVPVLVAIVALLVVPGLAPTHSKTDPAWPSLDGDYRQTPGRYCRSRYFSEGGKRCRRCLRHAGRHQHHVRQPELGGRDASIDLQPEHRQGERNQCAGGSSDWRHTRVFPGEGNALPSV